MTSEKYQALQRYSKDLTELARTPVAVVCAGPKAILDLRGGTSFSFSVMVEGWRHQMSVSWKPASAPAIAGWDRMSDLERGDYVRAGGTYVVQYCVPQAGETDNIGPLPIAVSRDRVAEEDAKVQGIDLKDIEVDLASPEFKACCTPL